MYLNIIKSFHYKNLYKIVINYFIWWRLSNFYKKTIALTTRSHRYSFDFHQWNRVCELVVWSCWKLLISFVGGWWGSLRDPHQIFFPEQWTSVYRFSRWRWVDLQYGMSVYWGGRTSEVPSCLESPHRIVWIAYYRYLWSHRARTDNECRRNRSPVGRIFGTVESWTSCAGASWERARPLRERNCKSCQTCTFPSNGSSCTVRSSSSWCSPARNVSSLRASWSSSVGVWHYPIIMRVILYLEAIIAIRWLILLDDRVGGG